MENEILETAILALAMIILFPIGYLMYNKPKLKRNKKSDKNNRNLIVVNLKKDK